MISRRGGMTADARNDHIKVLYKRYTEEAFSLALGEKEKSITSIYAIRQCNGEAMGLLILK